MFKFVNNKFKRIPGKICLSSPSIYPNSMEYVMEAYETNWMSAEGANINEIEKRTFEKVGCKYAVALLAGTAALHMAVRLAGVTTGQRVFLPHGPLPIDELEYCFEDGI